MAIEQGLIKEWAEAKNYTAILDIFSQQTTPLDVIRFIKSLFEDWSEESVRVEALRLARMGRLRQARDFIELALDDASKLFFDIEAQVYAEGEVPETAEAKLEQLISDLIRRGNLSVAHYIVEMLRAGANQELETKLDNLIIEAERKL